jgi:hypothetical protein
MKNARDSTCENRTSLAYQAPDPEHAKTLSTQLFHDLYKYKRKKCVFCEEAKEIGRFDIIVFHVASSERRKCSQL